MSLSSVEQDRREAAYHEAGHGVVAVALGVGLVSLTLWPVKPKNEFDRHFGGASKYHGTKKLSKLDRAAISYAGALAEMLLSNPQIEVEDYLSEGRSGMAGLSRTDRIGVRALHPSWRTRAINKSLVILKKHWNVIAEVALELEKNKDYRHLVHPYLLSAKYAKALLSPG